jgi:hypothetical protein
MAASAVLWPMPDGCFRIRTLVFSSFVFAVGSLGGCTETTDGSPPIDAGEHHPREPDADVSPVTDDPVDAGTLALEPGAWDAMDLDARKQFMRDAVLPTMRPLFQAFDGERFAAVSCKTCHGGGAQAGTFALPNPDLPVLSTEALKNPPDSEKPILMFMREVLKPTLAELLGKQDASDFRCTTCHTSSP